MSICNLQISHFYGVEFINEGGKKRSTRVRANSIGKAKSLGQSMEQAGEELFAVWMIG
jgi:hypothetical protein